MNAYDLRELCEVANFPLVELWQPGCVLPSCLAAHRDSRLLVDLPEDETLAANEHLQRLRAEGPRVWSGSYTRGLEVYNRALLTEFPGQSIEGHVDARLRYKDSVRVLDIGAGGAKSLYDLQQMFGTRVSTHAYSLDPYPHFPLNEYRLGSLEFFPNDMRSQFDVIVSTACFCLSRLPHRSMEAISRMLAPGGIAMIGSVEPFRSSPDDWGAPLLAPKLPLHPSDETRAVMQETWRSSKGRRVSCPGDGFEEALKRHQELRLAYSPEAWACDYFLMEALATLRAGSQFELVIAAPETVAIIPEVIQLVRRN